MDDQPISVAAASVDEKKNDPNYIHKVAIQAFSTLIPPPPPNDMLKNKLAQEALSLPLEVEESKRNRIAAVGELMAAIGKTKVAESVAFKNVASRDSQNTYGWGEGSPQL